MTTFGTCQALGPASASYTEYTGWPFFSGEAWELFCRFTSVFSPGATSSLTPGQFAACRQLLIDAATAAGVQCVGL